MDSIVNSVMNTPWSAGWTDSMAELVRSAKEVVDAFKAIFYLIGKLFGG